MALAFIRDREQGDEVIYHGTVGGEIERREVGDDVEATLYKFFE